MQITRAVAIRPLVDYVVRPDAYHLPAQASRPHDGFEVGAFAVISLGPLLGTSRKSF